MLANRPCAWRDWQIVTALALMISLGAGLWRVGGSHTGAILVVMLSILFALGDTTMLIALPRLRISFGSVGAQLLWLSLARQIWNGFALLLSQIAGETAALWLVVAGQTVFSLAWGWGAFWEPLRPRLTTLDITADLWPDTAPALRLLQISDLHVERLGRREEALLQLLRQVAPDLIVLTGDYMNLSCVEDPAAHADARRVLSALSAPLGVYAVLGSTPVDRNSVPLFDGLPIHLLRDERETLDIGQGRRITLIGLECGDDIQASIERLGELAGASPRDAFRLLLYHSPELIPLAPRFGIHLYLCGHTHGGQIRLPFYGAMITSSRLGKHFEMGHYVVGGAHAYVSRGVGLEGMGAPRVRFLCPSEITLFTVRGAPSEKQAA